MGISPWGRGILFFRFLEVPLADEAARFHVNSEMGFPAAGQLPQRRGELLPGLFPEGLQFLAAELIQDLLDLVFQQRHHRLIVLAQGQGGLTGFFLLLRGVREIIDDQFFLDPTERPETYSTEARFVSILVILD